MKTILFIVLVGVVVALGPLISIWALNTLFPALNIPYTWETWAAVVLVKSFLTVNITTKKD